MLIDDLLLLARTDSAVKKWGEVDIDDLVDQAVRKLRARDAVSVDTSAVSAGRVNGDASQLLRLVVNLLSNAERHATSAVKVSLRTDLDAVRLSVEDDGAGVPEQDRERIFLRFARSDDARARDEGGSGLGLAIASEIVRRHDGVMSVGESELGGALFVVELPVERNLKT